LQEKKKIEGELKKIKGGEAALKGLNIRKGSSPGGFRAKNTQMSGWRGKRGWEKVDRKRNL